LLADDRLTQSQIRFFLGYSGWSTQQLDQELELNSWVVAPNDYKNNIIGNNNNNLWKEKMLEFGGNYKLWSNAPQNPSYN
jgi:putative transcriptional regulator